jgi:hypothetical protein
VHGPVPAAPPPRAVACVGVPRHLLRDAHVHRGRHGVGAAALRPRGLPRCLCLDAGHTITRLHGLPRAPDGGPRRRLLRHRLPRGRRQQGRHQGPRARADGGRPRRGRALLRRRLPPHHGRGHAPRQLARVRHVRGLLRNRVHLRAPRGARSTTSRAPTARVEEWTSSHIAVAASAASVAVLLLLPLFMFTALVRRVGPYLPLLHRALLLA